MKQFFLQFGLIFGFTALAQIVLPWWILVVVAAGVSFFFAHQLRSFLAGFSGVGLLWFSYAYYLSMDAGGEALASKMGALFGDLNSFSMLLLTALLGALLGGLGAWTGTAGRTLLK